MMEEETYNFESEESNPDEERSELSITANDEMNSIFKNIASNQMDEEKDKDETKYFLNEWLYKHVNLIPIMKKIVEFTFHDQKNIKYIGWQS